MRVAGSARGIGALGHLAEIKGYEHDALARSSDAVVNACERALRLQKAGQLDDAELVCRQAIAEQPRHFPSRRLLGPDLRPARQP